jgi:type IV pilus assembly protein PilX
MAGKAEVSRQPGQKQRGAVLIVSLIILVLLTSLGVSVMQSAIVEQKIANNQRDSNTAMSAAEIAMRAAENAIKDPQNPLLWSDFEPGNNNAGLYPETTPGDDEPWKKVATWSGDGSIVVNISNGLYAKPPRYIIQRIGEFERGPSMTDKQTVRMIRITTLGYGTTENARVMLQADYQWK